MPQSRKAITNRAFCVRRCIGLNFEQWCAVESTKLQKHTEAHTHTHIRSNQPQHLNRKYESNPVYHCKSFFCACPQCPAFHIDNRSSVVLISNIQACVFMWMCAIVYDAMQCSAVQSLEARVLLLMDSGHAALYIHSCSPKVSPPPPLFSHTQYANMNICIWLIFTPCTQFQIARLQFETKTHKSETTYAQ